MAKPRVAWGIDIGNRALKAVKLVRTADGVKIDDFDVIEHENILSNAGDNRDNLIQTALAVFTSKHGLKGMPAAVGVSGQQSFARFIKLPPVEEKKIPEIVKFEAIQQIPFPLEEVEWSYQLFRDEASPDVEVGIFAMKKELVNQHLAFFTANGVNVQQVQMNPLAVYNALAFDQKIKGTTMVIDLGAENADLLIAEGEGVWMRSIPIGGNHFTEALVHDFKLRFERAEELKRTTATSPHGRRILQAMRPVFADLVSEIQRSIGFYSSTHRDSRIARVIAIGGTFKLPGLQKYLQQNLGLEVSKLDSLGQAPAEAKVAAALNENLLSSVSAYGLALQAMGEARINSSLLPLVIQKERMWKEKTKWFAAAAAMFVAGAAIPFGIYQMERSAFAGQDSIRTNIDSDIKRAQGQAKEYKDVESGGAEERRKIAEAKTLADNRDLWPSLYTELTGAIPAPNPKMGEKKGNRSQRQQIFLDDLEEEYVPQLGPLVAKDEKGLFKVLDSVFNERVGKRDAASMAGMRSRRGATGTGAMPGMPTVVSPGVPGPMLMPPTGVPGPNMPTTPDASLSDAAATPRHGFLITLHMTTPNVGGLSFASQTVVKNLLGTQAFRDRVIAEAMKMGADGRPGGTPPKYAYSIARVTIPIAKRIRDDVDMQQALAGRAREAILRRQKSMPDKLPIPGMQGAGASIDMRSMAGMPGMPAAPGMPTSPGGSAFPGAPSMPGGPAYPGTGTGTPGTPGSPEEAAEFAKLLVTGIRSPFIRLRSRVAS